MKHKTDSYSENIDDIHKSVELGSSVLGIEIMSVPFFDWVCCAYCKSV